MSYSLFQVQSDNQVTVGSLPWAALTGFLSVKQGTFGHLSIANLPEGCGGALLMPLLCEGLASTVWDCSTCPHSLLFSPSQPLCFIAVPPLLLLTFHSIGMIPHLPSHTALQCFCLCKIPTTVVRPKGCHKYPLLSISQVNSGGTVTLLLKSTDQTRKSQHLLFSLSILLKHAQFTH